MSDDNVVPLRLVEASRPSVNEEAIEDCERILGLLREGRALAVGFVVIEDRNTVTTGWSEGNCRHLLTAGALTLMTRLATP